MLKTKFEKYEATVPELHSERVLATQTVKEDSGEILTRSFFKHEFKPVYYVKKEEGQPPYWTGILPDDPSSYNNPLSINHYFKVKQKYFVKEYNGYLIYGLAIENEDEYELEEKEVNPKRVNLYKGWFERKSEFANYDYYVPLKTNQEFRWESANFNIVIPKYSEIEHNNLVKEKTEELTERGYTVKIIRNDYESTVLSATKEKFNSGGILGISYTLTTNQIVFEFTNIKNTGLAFNLTYYNCKIWLSKDGVEKTQLIVDHKDPNFDLENPNTNLNLNTEIEEKPDLKLYVAKSNPYFIVEPYIKFKHNKISNWPPVFLDTQLGNKTTVILEFIGRFYFNYKNEILDVQIEPDLIEYPLNVSPNLNDPKPYNIDIGYYTFESDDNDPDSWGIMPRGRK